MRVADLSVEELQNLITRTVEEVLVQLLPLERDDDGVLRDDIVARLRGQLENPGRTMSAQEFRRAAGLDA